MADNNHNNNTKRLCDCSIEEIEEELRKRKNSSNDLPLLEVMQQEEEEQEEEEEELLDLEVCLLRQLHMEEEQQQQQLSQRISHLSTDLRYKIHMIVVEGWMEQKDQECASLRRQLEEMEEDTRRLREENDRRLRRIRRRHRENINQLRRELGGKHEENELLITCRALLDLDDRVSDLRQDNDRFQNATNNEIRNLELKFQNLESDFERLLSKVTGKRRQARSKDKNTFLFRGSFGIYNN